jgi:hypothetical protein
MRPHHRSPTSNGSQPVAPGDRPLSPDTQRSATHAKPKPPRRAFTLAKVPLATGGQSLVATDTLTTHPLQRSRCRSPDGDRLPHQKCWRSPAAPKAHAAT